MVTGIVTLTCSFLCSRELQAASKSAPRFTTRLRVFGAFAANILQTEEGTYGLLICKSLLTCLPAPIHSLQNIPCRRPSATPRAGYLDLHLDSSFSVIPNLHIAQHNILAEALITLNLMGLIRPSLAGVQKSLLLQGSTSDGQISQFLRQRTRSSKQHLRRNQRLLLRRRE